MSFLGDLNYKIGEYTGFGYNGYAIHLPYYYAGKKTPSQIRNAISSWIGGSTKTQSEIQAHVLANPSTFGIDCSGLVYYVLNEATGGDVQSFFETQDGVTSGTYTYAYGINAAKLTNPSYGGTVITAANDVVPGCIIRSDNGGHVLVVHSVNKDSSGNVTSIVYAHSNSSDGPHHAYITIGDGTKDLNDSAQTLHDISYTDIQAKNYYNYTILIAPVVPYV